MARKYHNLAGLVRDLEHAIEAGGTHEWDLLSRLDNCLLGIEEADVSNEADVEDVAGEDDVSDDATHGHDEGREQLDLPRTGRMATDVPRGTSEGAGQPLDVAGATGVNRPVTRITMSTGRAGSKRRGT